MESLLKNVLDMALNCVNSFDRQTAFYAAVGSASFYFLVFPEIQKVFEFNAMPGCQKMFAPACREKKIELFSTLKENPVNSDGEVVVLELGVSFGPNLEYYPKGITFVGSDLHDFGKDQLREKCTSLGLDFKGYVIASAEDLSQIPTSSVSAIVTTLVTCSFKDCIKAFREIHRVLIPGGKYYFFEHTKEFNGSLKQHMFQFAAFPLLISLFYCHNRRTQLRDIEQIFGADNVNARREMIEFGVNDLIALAIRPHVYGTATKALY
ncbi:thiol S-methyltransferase TMT1B-like [Convolutriloba macropyga]|uniref:thiol S-methyltransferase TMT1B-like n=1 Tax=Convolutriloba macropyga TaxID=536237 RepID=UPI003F528C3A